MKMNGRHQLFKDRGKQKDVLLSQNPSLFFYLIEM